MYACICITRIHVQHIYIYINNGNAELNEMMYFLSSIANAVPKSAQQAQEDLLTPFTPIPNPRGFPLIHTSMVMQKTISGCRVPGEKVRPKREEGNEGSPVVPDTGGVQT